MGRLVAARGGAVLPAVAAGATALGSVALAGTLRTWQWFLPSMVAVVLVVAGAELARRTTVARAAAPLAGLAALGIYLVARFARAEAFLGVLPDRSAAERLRELLVAGTHDIAYFTAPIAVSGPVELIAVGGIGLVALAVHTLAVTLRRAALAGLPLLALYVVPATLAPDGVGWPAFALGGAGYLALLLAEAGERVSRWGRPVPFSPRSDRHGAARTAPLTQVGRRVGAAALGLALVVPALLPDLDIGQLELGGPGFGPGRGGGGNVLVGNPIVDLGRDLRRGRDVAVIRYSGPSTYLRVVGLDVFDGRTWQPGRLRASKDQVVANGMPDPPGLSSGVPRHLVEHRIEVLALQERWLPLPYPARKVAINGRWSYDASTFNVFGASGDTRGQVYRVGSLVVAPTADRLRAAPPVAPSLFARYLEVPAGMPAVVQRTAEGVTKGAATDFDKAVALQNWLRNPGIFVYSVDAPSSVGDGNGATAIAAFLEARSGYCVHFASAMAVMARQLGIPARVAVGFTGGTRQGDGRYVVTAHDLHSWPELYFEGVGWLAFEPTPAERTGDPPPYVREAATPVGGPSTAPTTAPGSSSTAAALPNPGGQLPEETSGRAAGDTAARPLWQRLHLPVGPTLLTLTLLLLASTPLATRQMVRRRRWSAATSPEARVAAAWAELHDTLVDYGCAWRVSDSPRRRAARLVEQESLGDDAADAVRRLEAAVERARYARAVGAVGDLRSDVATVAAALAASSRSRRLRARLLPRSTRAASSALLDRCVDALDALDDAAASLRARLTPGRRTTCRRPDCRRPARCAG